MPIEGQGALPFKESAELAGKSPRLLSVEELAAYLEVPVKTIYTWRHRRTGPKGLRVGKHLRFQWHDVQTWLAERMAEEA